MGEDPRSMLHASALGVSRSIIDPRDSGVRDCASAHRARLQRYPKVTIRQPVRPQCLTGSPHRDDLCMRGWILIPSVPILAFRDDLALPRDHCANGHLASFRRCSGAIQGKAHRLG